MKKKVIVRNFGATLVILALGWIALTIYVEKTGPWKQWVLGEGNGKRLLIIYDPDPFYNLDEQVCLSFGKAVADQNLNVRVVTVAAAEEVDLQTYEAVVYCANTYNWRPDWSIVGYIEDHQLGETKTSVVAITLGAGSTQSSQKAFEKTIINSGGKLMGSYSLWLWRPNDETKPNEPNVDVAISMAYDWGKQIAEQIK